jgi:hypothetical protein
MSTGKTYGGAGGMAAQGAGLSPEDLAGVMTYVRNNFGNSTGDVVTVEMAKAAMEISANAPRPASKSPPRNCRRTRQSPPGRPARSQSLVDPITLAPVAAHRPDPAPEDPALRRPKAAPAHSTRKSPIPAKPLFSSAFDP